LVETLETLKVKDPTCSLHYTQTKNEIIYKDTNVNWNKKIEQNLYYEIYKDKHLL